MESKEQTKEQIFDVSSIETDNKGNIVRQEGGFLVWVTKNGTKFRTRVPNGKYLDKVNGEWILRGPE